MVEILKAGLFDTIQDFGRFGVQEFGVPYSGAMDLYSAQVSNALVGNSKSDAVIEMTIIGPQLKFYCAAEIALSGADLSPKLNSNSIQMNTRICVNQSDILTFGRPKYGSRTYLAVKGGFQTEYVMNSFSMYKSITTKGQLKKGDRLSIHEFNQTNDTALASLRVDKNHFDINEIEVFKGMEFNRLSDNEQDRLFTTQFTVSEHSNRMAYQVNETIENNIKPIITSLVLPGTVQLTPSGQLLFLMRDCQTTGGYPRVLQVSEQSINHLAQKIFGQKFRLKCID
jgi:biotin-dependent carboxylase-like uncharacterized protein